jgi:hypothetical protein
MQDLHLKNAEFAGGRFAGRDAIKKGLVSLPCRA